MNINFKKGFNKSEPHTKAGFTLIELLVSIAIIAILATAVLWVISSAKDKNADAAVRHALSTVSSQAELFYLDNGAKYAVDGNIFVCSPAAQKSLYPIVLGAANNVSLTSIVVNNEPSGGSSLTTATCNNSNTAWAVEVPLKNKNIGGSGNSAMFCVDSTGFVGNTSASMGGLSVTCPSS